MHLPHTLSATAHALDTGALTSVELVAALLARIDRTQPVLAAFLTVTADHALDQARTADRERQRGRRRGALHGIPYGAKDNYDTAGIATTGHSRAYAQRVPHADAAVIERLNAAGAVLIGKLALHELAHGGPCFDLPWPPARNPWQPEHFTGGSSSGSAAALAAACALFTLGTDTGGSIRTPASLCGLVGFKPTFGLVSRRGVIPNSYGMDHCGPLTWTVEDCALVMNAIAGYDAHDRSSIANPIEDFRRAFRDDLRGVRIGVVRHFWERDVAAPPALARATEEALVALRTLGAQLMEVTLRPVAQYCDVWTLLEAPETLSIQRSALQARAHEFGRIFLERTLLACLIDAADHLDAQRARARLVDEMNAVWRDCDVLVTAGAGPAPRLSPQLAGWPNVNRYTPFALAGLPALVLPCGYDETGLPLSIQLVAPRLQDDVLLGIAHAYEQARGPARRPPDIAQFAAPSAIADSVPSLSPAGSSPSAARCRDALAASGLTADEHQLAWLCAVAPRLDAMKETVRGLVRDIDEPAHVFR